MFIGRIHFSISGTGFITKFFFTWTARNFPVNVKDTFLVPFPFQADRYGFYKPFTPLEWPIHQFILRWAILCEYDGDLILSPSREFKVKPYFGLVGSYIFLQRVFCLGFRIEIHFLGSMQYSGRLLFSFPSCSYSFLLLQIEMDFFSIVLCILSLTFYFNHVVPQFDTSSKTIKQMRDDNKRMKNY